MFNLTTIKSILFSAVAEIQPLLLLGKKHCLTELRNLLQQAAMLQAGSSSFVLIVLRLMDKSEYVCSKKHQCCEQEFFLDIS